MEIAGVDLQALSLAIRGLGDPDCVVEKDEASGLSLIVEEIEEGLQKYIKNHDRMVEKEEKEAKKGDK